MLRDNPIVVQKLGLDQARRGDPPFERGGGRRLRVIAVGIVVQLRARKCITCLKIETWGYCAQYALMITNQVIQEILVDRTNISS